MPGLSNSESTTEPRQVVHNSQGLRVTVRNYTVDDSTSTQNNNSDDLTSTSPPDVPIG